jgi:hypothetical protein
MAFEINVGRKEGYASLVGAMLLPEDYRGLCLYTSHFTEQGLVVSELTFHPRFSLSSQKCSFSSL